MKVVKFILFLLFGLVFINAGLNKIFMYLPTPEMSTELQRVNEAFNTIRWLMPLIAIVEITGGLLCIIPKTRALGAITIFPIIIGIMLHHIYHAPEGTILALILLLINLFILFDNREKYRNFL